jgi:hypothetical protein
VEERAIADEKRKIDIDKELEDIDQKLYDIDSRGENSEGAPIAGAKKAPDGNWYIQDSNGKYRPVIMEG